MNYEVVFHVKILSNAEYVRHQNTVLLQYSGFSYGCFRKMCGKISASEITLHLLEVSGKRLVLVRWQYFPLLEPTVTATICSNLTA